MKAMPRSPAMRALSPPRLEIPVLPEVPAIGISFLPSTPVSNSPELKSRSLADPARPTSPWALPRSASALAAPVYMAACRNPSPVPSTAHGGASPWRTEPPGSLGTVSQPVASGRTHVPGTGLEAMTGGGAAGSIAQRLNDTHLVPLRHMVHPDRCDSQTTQSAVTQAAVDSAPAPSSPVLQHRVVHLVPQPSLQQLPGGTPMRPAHCPGSPFHVPRHIAVMQRLPLQPVQPVQPVPVLRFSPRIASPRAVPTAEAVRQVQPQEPPPVVSPPATPATPPRPVHRGGDEASPSPETNLGPPAAGEDSLVRQLRELQHAKEEAAAAVAQGEQAILMRRGQLKRETFLALKSGGLSEALRHWPSPEHPAQASPSVGSPAASPRPERQPFERPPERPEQSPELLEELPSRSVASPLPSEEERPAATAEPPPVELEAGRMAPPCDDKETPAPAGPPAAPVRTEPEVTKTTSRVSKVGSVQSSSSRPLSAEEEAVRCCKTLSKIAGQITARHLRDLRKPRQLPPQVVKILQAIAMLLGHKDLKVSNLKKLLADTLPQKLSTFDVRRLSPVQRSKLRQLLSSPEVQPDAVAKVCLPFTSLAQWCECVMTFLSRTQPLQLEKEKGKEEKVEDAVPANGGKPVGAESSSKLLVEPDLRRLDPEELKKVSDLTVTKPNIGSVVFHGTTDCTNLDLQKDIVLKRGYVLVYPDAKRKPPLGEGLNKPATVTMYECFPPGEQIGEKEAKDYKEKIKRMTEENGACKFIDYDCQTGVWKFDVARF